MRKIIAVFLALLLLPSLAACKKNSQPSESLPAITGTWVTRVDVADRVNEMVYAQTGASTVSVAFPLVLELTIRADGTYFVQPDRQELDKQIDALGNVLWQIVVDQAAAQSHMSGAEAIEAMRNQGKTKQILLEQLDLASVFVNTYTENGVWKQAADRLLFAQDADSISAMEGYLFSVNADQLQLTVVQISEETQQTTEKTIVFTKQ